MSPTSHGLNRGRQAKIVATLGPASTAPEMIRELFLAGVDVFRMNFSHGKHEEHAARYDAIREVEREFGRPIAIMADLQGPKLRIGTFADGEIKLKPDQELRLDLDPTPGDSSRVHLPHPEIFEALETGHVLLLDDGKVRLEVTDHGTDFAQTKVQAGSKLSDRKGVNVPNAILNLTSLTKKDEADMAFALDLGVDWIALSFVQRPEDVAHARKLVDGRASILVKVEKPSAIYHIEDLIMLADAVMVARGDLGVEMPVEVVPGLQKQIIRHSRRAGKPVIVATQMLESMISAPTPTRAEASDVATAVFDGADGIMLSAETAAGDYPLEAVRTMDRIASKVERDPLFRAIIDAETYDPEATAADAITAAARQVARTVSAAAIVTYTTSGSTTLRAARERPEVPIICLTANQRTARRMVLSWGVYAVLTEDVDNFADMVQRAVAIARESGIAEEGQRLVITAGVPFGTPGTTNVLRLAWVD